MHLVVLHHHLNPGGVTRVVENHLLALATLPQDQRPQRVTLIYGGRDSGWAHDQMVASTPFELRTCVVPQLDYQELRPQADLTLQEEIAQSLVDADVHPAEAVLHWHNHSLGKNDDVPATVAALARRGYRTLLQIHDFAEDFRPDNYRALQRGLAAQRPPLSRGMLYPQSPTVHYAVLNGRDRGILEVAGVAHERLHLLPNPVAQPPVDAQREAARRLMVNGLELPAGHPLFLYPVRGIRRKNVGELLLWSAANPEVSFALTLAPKNPVERAPFDRWAALSQQLGLDCRLGIPEPIGASFGQALAASDALVTTSVAEGFGMAFLEAWLAGRRLLGRDMPEITADFTAAGLDLQELAPKVQVPGEWIDPRQYVAQLAELVGDLYPAFGLAAPPERDLSALVDQSQDEGIDFARLPTRLQRQVIQRIVASSADRQRLLDGNPQLAAPPADAHELIAANATTVRQGYSLAALGRRLAEVYQGVFDAVGSERIEPLEGAPAVLESFLRLDRLHPVRIET